MLPNIDKVNGLKSVLADLHANYIDSYCKMFIKAQPIEAAGLKGNTQLLIESNLCKLENNTLKPNFLVTKVFDMFIVTDLPTYYGDDRVLYLADQDSLLMARNMPNLKGKKHLDIGSGSGVQGLSACHHGAEWVTAIDISKRAIAFSTFNAALNGVKNIEFIHTSLQDFKPKFKYDFITSNLPFVPVPDNIEFMLSGAGGKDGLSLVHVFFQKIEELAHNFTSVLMISQSPGGKYISEIETIFMDYYFNRGMKIEAIDIFNATAPIDIQFQPFTDHPGLEAWKTWTKEKVYTHQHYLLMRVTPARVYSYERTMLSPKLEMVSLNLGSDNWQGHYDEIELARTHSKKLEAQAA